ncbi:hypothetical protein [Dyella sp. A6]|uniref:hypothetical protein n=1 Tax=Dyella aluminiiresistens TaxID=3069105 RepID=UPI002E795591|nr:hypothetical protein [Dyella sp. A6]
MVTLALFAFLVLISLPLTRRWVESVHQRNAVGILIDGLGRAKAIALRDPAALIDPSTPVAAVCLVKGVISVVVADTQGISCTQTPAWSQAMPSDASVLRQWDQIPLQCVAYSERGVPLSVRVGGMTCTQSPLDIDVGAEDAYPVSLP